MRKLKMFQRSRLHVFFFALVLGVVFAAGASVWATSIGTNISVDGTLGVTGATTLNGDATLGDASTDTIISTGGLNASSTLAVTGVSNLYSNLVVNGFATTTASTGAFATNATLFVNGAVTASSTMAVTGVTRLYGNVLVNGFATTTASNGNFAVNGSATVASTTLDKALTVRGNALQGSTATTTFRLDSTSSSQAGCIELQRPGTKATYRIFLDTSKAGVNGDASLRIEAGSCDQGNSS